MRPGELSVAYTQMETGSQLHADPEAFLGVEIYEPLQVNSKLGSLLHFLITYICNVNECFIYMYVCVP